MTSLPKSHVTEETETEETEKKNKILKRKQVKKYEKLKEEQEGANVETKWWHHLPFFKPRKHKKSKIIYLPSARKMSSLPTSHVKEKTETEETEKKNKILKRKQVKKYEKLKEEQEGANVETKWWHHLPFFKPRKHKKSKIIYLPSARKMSSLPTSHVKEKTETEETEKKNKILKRKQVKKYEKLKEEQEGANVETKWWHHLPFFKPRKQSEKLAAHNNTETLDAPQCEIGKNALER
ncbi:uncharacterized protein [Phyllobates terribilis]|uniref:uncharacterized protein n=1 Tax=Phyllobates terribilis TaxID=111132 RepID=UPI003CCA79AC